jgi:hypothetical protein
VIPLLRTGFGRWEVKDVGQPKTRKHRGLSSQRTAIRLVPFDGGQGYSQASWSPAGVVAGAGKASF